MTSRKLILKIIKEAIAWLIIITMLTLIACYIYLELFWEHYK